MFLKKNVDSILKANLHFKMSIGLRSMQTILCENMKTVCLPVRQLKVQVPRIQSDHFTVNPLFSIISKLNPKIILDFFKEHFVILIGPAVDFSVWLL